MMPVEVAPAKTPAKPPEEEPKAAPKLREISPEELRHILEEHRKWIKSNGKEGMIANLENCHLEGDIILRTNPGEVNLEKAKLTGANLKEAILPDAKLEEAKLQKADLRGARLWYANLQQANLTKAKLQGAEIWNANLRKAEFLGANLRLANLAEANLQEAFFNHTILREVNLQDANLTGAKGLLANQLGGANVSGAKLPEYIAKFEGLGQVKEISQRAQKLFLSLLLGCGYCWLTIATTTDVALMTNSGSSPLPIIQTKIPLAGFYWAAPLILLSLYFWLHLYLQRLWEELAALPAIFPDGKTLDKKVYPWLVSGLVRTQFHFLRENPPALSRLQTVISIFLTWWLVPITLVLLWLRYLPKHDWEGTFAHILFMVLTSVFAAWSQALAKRTLRGQEQGPLNIKENWRKKVFWATLCQRFWKFATLGLVVLLFTGVVSDGAINGIKPPKTEVPIREIWQEEKDNHRTISLGVTVIDEIIYPKIDREILSKANENKNGQEQKDEVKGGFPSRTEWEYVDLGKIKHTDTARGNQKSQSKEQEVSDFDYDGLLFQAITWYRTRIPDFLSLLPLIRTRAFANFRDQEVSSRPSNWFLMRESDAADIVEVISGAQLQEENLRGVDAEGAFLMKADLRRANLIDANLKKANLNKANLNSTRMENASLAEANLHNANLIQANLQNAAMSQVNLQNANLYEAKMENADLYQSDLSNANLWGANLSWGNLPGTKLQYANLRQANLKHTNLAAAKLQNAILVGSNLQNAVLIGAQLQGADLRGANMQQANLDWAELKDTNLLGVDLSNVVNLTQAQLNQACVNKKTKLPEGLVHPEPCKGEKSIN